MTKKREDKKSQGSAEAGWSPLAALQGLIEPLTERLRNRKRKRNARGELSSGASGEPLPSKPSQTKSELAEAAEPAEPATSPEISGSDLAIEFHDKMVENVMAKFLEEGWEPALPEDGAFGYDFELTRGKEKVAVQVRSQKARVYLPQLRRFEDFLDSSEARRFARGFLISNSGFAGTVFAYMDSEGIGNISLGTLENGTVRWFPEEDPTAGSSPREKRYIGVFTCKGGVGKTTISAHLAGAFALCGYHVVLVDLDRQGNLRKLMGEGIYLPHPRKKAGTTITVLDQHEWDENRDPETGIVICDCNPEFSQNPVELMSRFDYCLIPTTLNPLGINKNGFIIRKTFQEIRNLNRKTEMFVVINNFDPAEKKRNQVLNDLLKNEFKGLSMADPLCHYIDPDDVSIRFSKQLLYWGYETVIEDAEPQLSFRAFGGRSLPRSDFLALAEYLQNHSDLDKIKKALAKTPVKK